LGGHHGHGHATDGTADFEPKDHPKSTRETVQASVDDMGPTPPCCAKDPVNQLNAFHKMASILQHEKESSASDHDDGVSHEESSQAPKEEVTPPVELESLPCAESEELMRKAAESKRLVKMGMTTALAIALHNFPEGLATFVSGLNDPKVGLVFSIAIAIHNIPEGLCVALPIFYATGNRRNAFLWALLSGASEIVAALLGWAILANRFSEITYAVLFGMVAGMMVIISIRELLPTAHFYDPEDTVVTNSFIVGMAVIALSLVLFQLTL
jgi:ZIP family zinc transporter